MKINFKRVSKRALSLVLCVLMLFSTMIVGSFTTNATNGNVTSDGSAILYFNIAPSKADWWTTVGSGGANFAYFFNNSTGKNAWSEAAVRVTGNYYYVKIPSGTWECVILTRNNTTTSPSWNNNLWNQTGDIVLQTDKNYISDFAEKSATATWGTYQPVVSSASLTAGSTEVDAGTSVTLTSAINDNTTYNAIKSNSYEVTGTDTSGAAITSSDYTISSDGTFTPNKGGTYTITDTITYNAKGYTSITKTITASVTITVNELSSSETTATEPTTTEATEPTTTEATEPTTTEATEPTTTEVAEPTTSEATEPTTTEANYVYFYAALDTELKAEPYVTVDGKVCTPYTTFKTGSYSTYYSTERLYTKANTDSKSDTLGTGEDTRFYVGVYRIDASYAGKDVMVGSSSSDQVKANTLQNQNGYLYYCYKNSSGVGVGGMLDPMSVDSVTTDKTKYGLNDPITITPAINEYGYHTTAGRDKFNFEYTLTNVNTGETKSLLKSFTTDDVAADPPALQIDTTGTYTVTLTTSDVTTTEITSTATSPEFTVGYTVEYNGTKSYYQYKDKATVTADHETYFLDSTGAAVYYGTSYSFFVVGDVTITTDDNATTLTNKAILDKQSSYFDNDGYFHMNLAATGITGKFVRMGVAFAKSERTEEQIKAAVNQVGSSATTTVVNGMAVHNAGVAAKVDGGNYQFVYSPYTDANATGALYFYTYVVYLDANGDEQVAVSSAVPVTLQEVTA